MCPRQLANKDDVYSLCTSDTEQPQARRRGGTAPVTLTLPTEYLPQSMRCNYLRVQPHLSIANLTTYELFCLDAASTSQDTRVR